MNADSDAQAKLVESLIALLKRRGHLALLPKIIRSIQELGIRAEKESGLLVTLGDHAHLKRFEAEIEATAKEVFGDASSRSVSVDPTLVGGFVLKRGDVRVDASYKRHLISFFNIFTGAQSN
jgi:F0F1-type ATP synthase delta subunit